MSQAISASFTGSGSQPVGLRLLRALRGHSDVIHRMSWSPDLRHIASPSRDGTVRIWDFETGETRLLLGNHDSWVNSVAWSPDGSRLACGTENGRIFIWTTANGSRERVIRGHRGRIEDMAWSPGPDILASASADGTVAIWRASTGEEARRLDDHMAWVNAVAWSPDGRYLATGAEDPTVKLWDGEDFRLLHTLKGHGFWVTDVAWTSDSSLLASAAGQTIRLWDPLQGRLVRELTGHEDRVKCLSFSSEGKLLASKGEDHAVRLWRCDNWHQVLTLEEPTLRELNPESNLAFHPTAPVLATLGDRDTIIRLWSVDLDCLLDSGSTAPEVFYRNAKVVLVGASSTGKSCLARALMGYPFAPQESTHGMKVWNLSTETVADDPGRPVHQELFLWDLAGQTDYQIIHQLFLDQTSLSIILFDPTDPEETLPNVQYWVKALRKAVGANLPRILVAGRVDRGGPALSETELNAFLSDHGLEAYVATSAKTGEGIQHLNSLLRSLIPWEEIPLTHSPKLWRDLRGFVLTRREEADVLTRCSDLKIAFRIAQGDDPISDRAFDTVIAHLQAQGIIWRLSFGDLILLRPELLNDYASSVVLAARNHSQGLGSVLERDILDGQIDLSAVERIANGQAERSLLHAVVERFLECQIALREGEYLVFPSRLNLPKPVLPEEAPCDTIYHFEGPAEEIYATLIVRLESGGAFELHKTWRNGALFRDAFEHLCGISFEQRPGAKHQMGLHFDRGFSMELRVLFSRFVHDHLHRRAVEGSVERERLFRCDRCSEEIQNSRAIEARLRDGKTTIVCQFCDSDVRIVDELERKFADPAVLQRVRDLEQAEKRARDSEVGLTKAIAKRDIDEHDVFLAYNSAEEQTVEKVATALQHRGINPWFAKWCLPPGRQFQREIQRVFFSVRSVAVFIGQSGVGPWEDLEIRAAIQMFVKRNAPVIPILLPGAKLNTDLPLFLEEFSRVSFENGIDDVEALDQLEWGITGLQPQRKTTGYAGGG